jgi:predicted nucleotidyltransferase
MVFPHLGGYIRGFGEEPPNFEVWQKHHIKDQDKNQEYDMSIYGICKYFQLVMENNPNIVDILFTPQRCVLFCSSVAQIVRDKRKLFLHKGCYQKMRGYSYAQLHKIGTKANASNPKRQASIEQFGYDVKFGYNVIRLLLECEQILIEHDLDIELNSEILKSVRRGDWSEEKLRGWFDEKEKHLEELYIKSTLRHAPDEEAIKDLLMHCLEQHYGSLDQAVKREVPVERMISELKAVLEKYEGR